MNSLDQIAYMRLVDSQIIDFLSTYEYVLEDTEERIFFLFFKWLPKTVCVKIEGLMAMDFYYKLSIEIIIKQAILKRKKEILNG